MREYPIEKLLAIKDELEKNGSYKGFEFVGVRVQDENKFELGKLNHSSMVWEDGDIMDEELSGACALDITRVTRNTKNYYFGEYMAIIAGNVAYAGNDANEIIIEDAEVIDVL